ncbi:hypothetical protein AVEN_78081-1 [Araneus ventricosus]|uniref:Uncharacterized protein n=1 Tax=Araneus ventricosus TaxID=182803 RepID=A0A4Y2F356_ARAVE|nr:hypothetical protein AVEN_78081-1 [Araneus ventricosus]
MDEEPRWACGKVSASGSEKGSSRFESAEGSPCLLFWRRFVVLVEIKEDVFVVSDIRWLMKDQKFESKIKLIKKKAWVVVEEWTTTSSIFLKSAELKISFADGRNPYQQLLCSSPNQSMEGSNEPFNAQFR